MNMLSKMSKMLKTPKTPKTYKRKITSLFVVLLLFIPVFFLQANRDPINFFKEVYRSSPLKNKFKNTTTYKTQEAFHSIYKGYENKVVFISTEKNVEITTHPYFMEDPLFRYFFEHNEGPANNSPKRYKKQSGLGTGFIISSDGYICTNHHVVAQVDLVTVKVGDKTYKAKVLGTDERTDIALLKINGARGLEPAYFADSDDVKVGDWAIAIGNPFGLDRTFTVGVVSAIAREDLDKAGNAYIQTDASINTGNSGGPLLNINGEVIGVNRMIYSKTGGSLGIGFAIPINTAYKILENLKKDGKIKRGYIGISVAVLTPEFSQTLGLKKKTRGIVVAAVIPKSPASASGLQIQDVILELNGKTLDNPRDLINKISKLPIGKTIRLKLWRNGKVEYAFVTIREQGK